MWLGLQTVSSLERCALFSVLYREVPLYLWYLGESNTHDREPTPRYSTWYCPLSLSPAASCLNLIRSITYRALQRESGRRGREERVGGREERVGGREERVGGREERVGGREERVGGREKRVGGREERVEGREERVGGREERVGGRREWEGGEGGRKEESGREGGRKGWEENRSNHTQVVNTQGTMESCLSSLTLV